MPAESQADTQTLVLLRCHLCGQEVEDRLGNPDRALALHRQRRCDALS
jgi:hypothetical protein